MTKVSELQGLIGEEVGVSKWFDVTQARIDAFADCTEDHQFIHVDPEAAMATPFGGTIAHGFLTLSLMPLLSLIGRISRMHSCATRPLLPEYSTG